MNATIRCNKFVAVYPDVTHCQRQPGHDGACGTADNAYRLDELDAQLRASGRLLDSIRIEMADMRDRVRRLEDAMSHFSDAIKRRP